MDDRGVNIDIVFRNGLKDYEVLPPADVWDKIRPIIRKKQQPYILLRAAAIIAVALSLSFLAYRWSREISAGQEENVQAQNTESAVPSSSEAVSQPGGEIRGSSVLLSDASVPAYQQGISGSPENDYIIQSIENPSLTDALPGNNPSFTDNSGLIIKNTVINSPEADMGNLPLIPENIEQTRSGRWSIAALVSPSYHNRITTGNNETMAQMMASEQPLISYSGGVALSYRINKRLSVQSGVYYSSVGRELSGISSYSGFSKIENTKGASFDIITANGTIKTNNTDIFLRDNETGERVITSYTSNVFDPVKAELQYIDNSLHQNFGYLELPVVLRYKVVDKTLDFNIIGGISSNLLVNNSVSAGSIGNKYQIGGTNGLNIITFSSSFGMGMEYSFSEKLSMNLEPTLRYYINPFGAIPGLKIHPYSFGIFSGLSYRF